MRRILFLLLLLLPLSTRADVVEGVAVDAVTGEPLPEASITLKQGGSNWWSEVSSSADSLGRFSLNVPNDGRAVITATMLGYHRARLMLYAFSDGSDTIRVDTLRLQPTELMLQQVVVSAKMKRFTMSGDTIIFHPEAFKLEEGARLEELIRKLPGIAHRDGKLYWNNKPIRMVMNGHDVFGGSDMLSQLPAAAADKLKVYDRKTDLERRSGNDDGEEDQVLDINIKKGFLDKWYGNVEAGAATRKHYEGTLRATRLSDDDPVLVFGNMNNLNTEVSGSMNWTSSGGIDQFGKQLFGNLAYQHNWHPDFLSPWERNEYDAEASLTHIDGWGDSRTSTQTFFPDEAATYTLSRGSHASHRLAPKLSWNLWARTDTANRISVTANMGFERRDNHSESASVRTDSNPFAYGSFPLDPLLEASEGDSLYRSLVNRERNYSTNKTDRFTGSLNASWVHNLGKKGDLTTQAAISYDHSVQRSHDNRNVEYAREAKADRLFQYGRTPGHNLRLSLSEGFNYWLSKHVNLVASDEVSYVRKQSTRDFYAASDEALLRDSSDQAHDAANSYRSRNRTLANKLSLRGTIGMGKAKLMPQLDMTYQHEKMDYRRGRLDTTATRNSLVASPSVRYSLKIDRTQKVEASFRYDTQLPSLLSTLAYRDDTDPLYITEGNPSLHRSHSHSSEISWQKILARLQMDYTLALSYTKQINPVSGVVTYTPSTGAYRSHEENVRGGDRWQAKLYFYKSIGVLFHVKNDIDASFDTGYGYLTTVTEGSGQPLNRTRTLRLAIRPEFGIETEWVEASLYGDISMARYRYSRSADFNSTPVDYTYGVKAKFSWKQWQLSTDIHDRARSGYLSADYNGHHVMWNAKASYKLLKNKAKVSLRLVDILHQDKSYSTNYSSYQRSESWQSRLSHYAELQFSYNFDAKGN